jgi:hypothetical protein
LEQCILISGSIPTLNMGVILSTMPFGVYGEVCSQELPVPIPVGRPQPMLPLLPLNRIASPSPSLAMERVESTTAVSAKSTRQVRPETARFIERVLVPALVKRYIAKLSSTGEQGGLTG